MNKKPKQVNNDQGDIIEALDFGDYNYVWDRVKPIGYKIIPDMYERYSIFNDLVEKFKPAENNNFIKWYMSQLKFIQADKNETFYLPSSRSVIGKLKKEYISPTDCEGSHITKELKLWNN